MEEKKRAHLLVSGVVQGVYFRASTKNMAERLGLYGWVRNLPSGRVEVVFEGKSADVDRGIEWCGKGPEMSHVEGVEIHWEKPTEELESFELRF